MTDTRKAQLGYSPVKTVRTRVVMQFIDKGNLEAATATTRLGSWLPCPIVQKDNPKISTNLGHPGTDEFHEVLTERMMPPITTMLSELLLMAIKPPRN